MEGETVVGNPSSIRVVRVILKFFSAGNEFSFFTTIIKSFITGSRTIAASITLKSGLKNSLVSENVLKSFVVT
ncbi:unknown [Phocaeicola vulgatus CAG:6]|nr:unknown [Phocaeicola vulgatus CAG:6]